MDNLILHKDVSGNYNAYIAEYSLTPSEKREIENGGLLIDKTPTTILNFETSSRVLTNTSDCVTFKYEYGIVCHRNDGTSEYYPPNTYSGGCNGRLEYNVKSLVAVIIDINCGSGGGSGGGSNPSVPTVPGNGYEGGGHGGGGNSGDRTGYYPSNPGTGDGTGNTPTPQTPGLADQDGNPLVTTPILIDDSSFRFFRSLTPEQNSWWDDRANAEYTKDMTQYLLENNYSEEAIDFVTELINTGISNELISFSPVIKYPIGSNYSNLYPRLTEYLKNKLPRISTNQFILNKLSQFSELSIEQIKNDLKWGNGPILEISQLDRYGIDTYGVFNPLTPNVLYLDVDLVNLLENSIQGPEGDSLAFLVGVVILHEYVHFGDHIDGIDQPGEEGLLFEESTYGETMWINNAHEILIKRR